ncbi:MAG: cytochrome P450 [Polyangiaceae bacterium]
MKQAPPSPTKLPWVGHLPFYVRDPMRFLQKALREHGDVVQLQLGGIHSWLLGNPADIETVLVTQNKCFEKDNFAKDLQRILGQGLITSEGEFWRRQRRLAQPAFHREKIASFATTMVDAAEREAARWWPGQVRDVHVDMMRVTLDIVARTLFNTDVAEAADEIGHIVESVMNRYADWRYAALPVLDRIPTKSNREFDQGLKRLDELIYEIIDKTDENGSSFVSMLRAARDEDGSQMSPKQLRDEVVTLILAGHETTALALSWTWLALSRQPVLMQRLHAELNEVLGGRSPTLDDLPRLKLTSNIIHESLRMYPPAWSTGRLAIAPCDLGGYQLQPGQQVWVPIWAVHRDPRWYSHPEVFDPDRWNNDLLKKLPKFAYMPFGGGPRLCIGQGFAMIEAVLLLATFAQRFKVEVLPDHPIDYIASVTMRPKHGIRAEVQRWTS